MKRLFDIFLSAAGLLLLSPIFAMIAISIRFDSNGSVFFRQERIGRFFKPFKIYKFRTMKDIRQRGGPNITVDGDRRITRFGRFLRSHKLDELPQLINILKGEMSFVGPRPEIREYVELYKSEYERLLKVRPGMTDPASIEFSQEEKSLSLSKDWEEEYIQNVLPKKISLSSHYIENRNFLADLTLIYRTLFKIV